PRAGRPSRRRWRDRRARVQGAAVVAPAAPSPCRSPARSSRAVRGETPRHPRRRRKAPVTTYRSDTGVTSYRTIASQDDLEALHDQWDELVRSAPRPCPFFTEAWLGAWRQHPAAARRMLVEASFDGDRLVGA